MVIILDKDLKKEIEKDINIKEKMNPQQFKQIKQTIENLEYYQNRMNLLNSTSVEAKNIRIRGNKIIVDIYIIYEDRVEKYLDSEYNLNKLLEKK